MKIQQCRQHPGSRARQRGLTLIELVVVLAILVALAGLIINNFPGIISRAHTSTCATTVGDVNKFESLAGTTGLGYPSGYDSLLNDGNGPAGLFSLLPGHTEPAYEAAGGVGGALTAGTVDANESTALAAIGITNSYNLNPTAADATWSVTDYGSQNVFGIAQANVALVNNSYIISGGLNGGPLWPNEQNVITNDINAGGTTKYVIFGVGPGTQEIGPSGLIQEAPTHFGDNEYMDPQNNYQRYGVVFRIDDNPLTGTNAVYAGAVALHDDSLGTTEGDTHDYYNLPGVK
ncbi:MAG TPA: type II secretion system protein [Pseudomonadales bacterium]|nr:type II secretion system protein [Pseudomonadales bacterium]